MTSAPTGIGVVPRSVGPHHLRPSRQKPLGHPEQSDNHDNRDDELNRPAGSR